MAEDQLTKVSPLLCYPLVVTDLTFRRSDNYLRLTIRMPTIALNLTISHACCKISATKLLRYLQYAYHRVHGSYVIAHC